MRRRVSQQAALAVALAMIQTPAAFGAERVITLTPVVAASQTADQLQGYPATSSTGATTGVALILTTARISDNIGPVILAAVKNVGPAAINVEAANFAVATDAGPAVLMTAELMEAIAKGDRRPSWLLGGYFLPGTPLYAPGGDKTIGREAGDRIVGYAQQRANSAAMNGRGSKNTVDSIGFRPFLVEPGQTVVAPVPISPLPLAANRLELKVKLNGEDHNFAYSLTRAYSDGYTPRAARKR